VPASVIADDGARYPAQRLADGSVLVAPELGALAASTFRASGEPVAGAHWEVGPRVIDNGRVRAELDERGRVARLCWDGSFAALDGPALVPVASADSSGLPEHPLDGAPAEIAVAETGPVRATILVTRRASVGTLRLRYVLLAHDDALRVEAEWEGTMALSLGVATSPGIAIIGDHQAVRPSLEPGWQGDCAWVAISDEAEGGIALAGAAQVHLSSRGARFPVAPAATVALLSASRGPQSLSLPQSARSLALPHQPHAGPPSPEPFRLWMPPNVETLAVGAADGWLAEVSLVELAGGSGRAYLYPATAPTSATLVDERGQPLGDARLSPDGDAIVVDLGPRQVVAVRWR
jgi:hypothetical protein